MRGNGESAAVREEGATASIQDLQEGLADMASSPVDDPSSENPVDSPKHLAAAASMDDSALKPLKKEPPEDSRGPPKSSEVQQRELQQRSAASG